MLDAAMKDILRAAATSDSEIDAITAKPYMYAAIRQRINSEGRPFRTPTRRPLINFAYSSLVLVAVTAAIALLSVDSGQHDQPVAAVVGDEVLTSEPLPASVPDGFVIQPVKASAGDARRNKQSSPKRGVRKEKRRTERKLKLIETPQLPDTFYALDYNGVAVESLNGGRVVRVSVPRSSLFALGVNVPLENESAAVQADLMFGPDGVARAIRLVD